MAMLWTTLYALTALQLPPTAAKACAASPGIVPEEIIARSVEAMGIPAAAGRVLHYSWIEGTEQNFQSDRPYPPFFSAYTNGETWADPENGIERMLTSSLYAGTGPTPPRTMFASERATYMLRNEVVTPVPMPQDFTLQHWTLNPWAVLQSWRRTTELKVTGTCMYRDFPRLVIERKGPYGAERLYLDPESSLPVKIDLLEPHFLWGQQHVEYVYSNWKEMGGPVFPLHAFRVVDGEIEITRSIGNLRLIRADSAPSLLVPAAPPPKYDRFLETYFTEPDTVRVSANTFLLTNRQYTHAVTLQRDTIFLLDATTDARRARADSVWIGKLFPGRHPIVLVVTDLAWPHIGGVRYWVASGARVISHRTSRDFLEQVIRRRWTSRPDLLEQRRSSAVLKFRAVEDRLTLAGGDLQVYNIGGIGSEGALMAFIPRDGFLWASDYIQNVQSPSSYAREVWRRARNLGLEPATTAAQHIPLTPWSVIQRLVGN